MQAQRDSDFVDEVLANKLEAFQRRLKEEKDRLGVLVNETEKLRTASKINFYDKVSTLAAGSIALMVSFAGLSALRGQSFYITHLSHFLLLTPPCLAWLSLCTALAHNFFANRAQDIQNIGYRNGYDCIATLGSSMSSRLLSKDLDDLERESLYYGLRMKECIEHSKRLESLAFWVGALSLFCFALTYLFLILIFERLL